MQALCGASSRSLLSSHYHDPAPLFTVSLSVFPALNVGEVDADIETASPVLGLRPAWAGRLLVPNVPNPPGLVGNSCQNELTALSGFVPGAVAEKSKVEEGDRRFAPDAFDLRLRSTGPDVNFFDLDAGLGSDAGEWGYVHEFGVVLCRAQCRNKTLIGVWPAKMADLAQPTGTSFGPE